jgi:electron transfer flavoprotein alpha/beta subunit
VRIVVCLHAPRQGDSALGRDDAHALAHALTLGPGHTVTAVLAGDASQVGPLLRALSAGATRAVRFTGEDYSGADFHTLGQALATGIRRVGADLVLMGARSENDGLGGVPASAARQLGMVHVASIETLAAGADRTVTHVEVGVRGGGRWRRLRVSLPAVLSVSAGPPGPFAPPDTTGNPADVESLSLVDPDTTLVRRRLELLGRLEPAARGTALVSSAGELVEALAGLRGG